MARWLNVSQATVREALVQLEQSGLVVRSKNRKTQVARLTEADVRDRLAMLLALEPIAAVRAVDALDNADLAELDKRITAMASSSGENSQFSAAMAHMEFHQLIWERTGSPVLFRTLEQLTTPLFAFMQWEHLELVDPHRAILEALQSGKKDVIEQKVRADLEGFLHSGDHAVAVPAPLTLTVSGFIP